MGFGEILRVQSGAEAMTLDRHVFTHTPLQIDTYVHELVHVTQYALVGRPGFLVSYFGLSAAEIARRFVKREQLNVMDSSPHENRAYELERRFRTWLRWSGRRRFPPPATIRSSARSSTVRRRPVLRRTSRPLRSPP